MTSPAPPSLVGQQLGTYRIDSLVGSGGMGAVYRARDLRLGRDVAVKVLLTPWATDPERLARFDREARVLAALNHPHIATIHGIEDSQGIRALILEFVDGETLAERIARPQPVTLAEALAISRQIAEALDAAHEKGVVHRDLKPANVKVSSDGVVKVLDFGLARLSTSPAVDRLASQTTDADHATLEGVILGTAAYMSPEQARGQQADRRVDIWAFGCVLYELLTKRRAFAGSTLSDTIAAILTKDPDWSALPPSTPAAVRRLLERCLEKDPKRRLRDIGDVRADLEDALSHPAQPQPVRPQRWRTAAAAAALIALGGTAAWMLQPGADPEAPEPARFVIELEAGAADATVSAFTISPDGRFLVFEVSGPQRGELRVKQLSAPDARTVIELPDRAPASPFFSPDSRWIGFFSEGKLKKIPLEGGPAVTLAEAPSGRGGTWGDDGTIVFAPLARSGLQRVSADGGRVETLTTPDVAKGETSHREPFFLPGAGAILFTARGSTDDQDTIAAASAGGDGHRVLLEGAIPRYIRTGQLLFERDAALFAAAFDPVTLQVHGGPTAVLDDVGWFTVSDTGTMFYRQSSAIETSTVVWVDRRGSAEALPLPPGRYIRPRLSPDGSRVVLNTDRSIGIFDLRRATFTPLTFEGSSGWPVWTARGDRVVYASVRPGTTWDLVWRPADGSGREEPLLVKEEIQHPGVVAADGTTVAYVEVGPGGWDVALLSIGSREGPRIFQGTPAREESPHFSPDGRWLAYVSDVSGTRHVYVRPLTGDGVWQVTGGGTEPVWSPTGKEIFYRKDRQMLSIEVSAEPAFALGTARVLFEGNFLTEEFGSAAYDVTPDGQRFLMVRSDPVPTRRLTVIVNWQTELLRRFAQ